MPALAPAGVGDAVARFRIDDPEIDIEALEAQIAETIAKKRGTRFSDAELEEIRRTPLRPRLRREDLPRGLMNELGAAHGRLPALTPSPGATPAAAVAGPRDAERPPLPESDALAVGAELYSSGSSGVKGRMLAGLRLRVGRFLIRFLNLEHTLQRLADEVQAQDRASRDYASVLADTLTADVTRVEERLERSFDALKDNLDGRIDAQSDWAGAHVSELTGKLDGRHERQLHLAHNVVFELTNARLDLLNMQDRLNEMARRIETLEARERALEKLTLGVE